jgi:hypothetical protein
MPVARTSPSFSKLRLAAQTMSSASENVIVRLS